MKRLYEKENIGIVGFPDGTIFINTHVKTIPYKFIPQSKSMRPGRANIRISTFSELNLGTGKKIHTFHILK